MTALYAVAVAGGVLVVAIHAALAVRVAADILTEATRFLVGGAR